VKGPPAPKAYSHLLDPFVALTAAAGATRELRLGTGICIIVERDTIQTAKAVASLDHVSGGRVLFGVGAGWNKVEMENHGADYDSRYKKLCDQIEAFKVIWRDDEAQYHGSHVDFDAIYSWPKPVQSPHPPILLGGESIHTLRRIVKHCDGWLPRGVDLDLVLRGMQTLKRLADEAERDIPVSVFAPYPDEESLQKLKDAGVERAILMLPAEVEAKTMSRMDRLTRFVD
jgi:probable F420-dependent oxidoreductase